MSSLLWRHISVKRGTMATLRKARLFVTPWIQCCHASKINVKKPRKHYERRLFEAVTAPIVPRIYEDPLKTCNRVQWTAKEEEEENLYEKFLVRQCKKIFTDHQMVIICQRLSMTAQETKAVRNKLTNAGLGSRIYSNALIRKAITDTPWINISPLLYGHNLYIVSEEVKLAEVAKVTKKLPSLLLLGGIVRDRILTRDAILRYASLPSLEAVLGQTVALLNSPTQMTNRLLNTHQQTLSTNLSQYVKQDSEESSSDSTPGET